MSKKQLNEQNIVNELKGGSVFFRGSQDANSSPAPKHAPSPLVEVQEGLKAGKDTILLTSKETSKKEDLKQKSVEELPKSNRTPVRPYASPSVRPYARTPVRVQRRLTRYAFEFFQDQVDSLKKISLEQQMRGENGSMSQMVREALDAYIAKRERIEE